MAKKGQIWYHHHWNNSVPRALFSTFAHCTNATPQCAIPRTFSPTGG